MTPDQFVVEVRDRDLARLGQIVSEDLVLTADLADPAASSGPGSWTLTLPRTHHLADALLTPGAGLIVTHAPTGRVLWSGPVSVPSQQVSLASPGGMLTVNGFTDDVLLWRRRAYPTPSAPASAQVDGYDVRSGAAETVMHAYVSANLGATADTPRRVAGLTFGADGARGGTVKASARFDTLGDLLVALATVSGVRFRVVQEGTALQFQTYVPQDRSATVRLSLASGTLTSQRVEFSAPGVTDAIVAGQGEGADRTMVERTTADAVAAVTAWGPWARSEQYVDQRQTDDPDELAQAGDKVLAENAGGTAVHLIPSDTVDMPWPDAWDAGDTIAVETDGAESPVAVTTVSVRIGPAGVKVGAGVGNPPAVNPLASVESNLASTQARVEALERTVEATPQEQRVHYTAWNGTPPYLATDLPGAYPPGVSAFIITSSASGWPTSYGTVTTTRVAPYTTQRLVRFDGQEWHRAGENDTTWRPWLPIADTIPEMRPKTSAFSPSKVDSGVTLTSITYGALPIPTMIEITVAGVGGFHSTDVTVTTTLAASAGTLDAPPHNGVFAHAAQWAPLTQVAWVTLPANTATTITAKSLTSSSAYFRGALRCERRAN